MRRAIQTMLVVLGGWRVMAAAEPEFRLIPITTAAPEGGVMRFQELLMENQRFALKLPEKWGVQLVSSNQSLMILEPDLRAGIQLRLWPQEGQEEQELAAWLKRIEERSGGAILVRQFRARGAAAEGWGFDLVRKVDRATSAGLRVILVPYPGGMAEFELRAPAGEVAEYYRVLRHLVASFAPRGGVESRSRPPASGVGGR